MRSKERLHIQVDIVENGWVVVLSDGYNGSQGIHYVFNDIDEMNAFISEQTNELS